MDDNELAALDARGYTVLEAITAEGRTSATHSASTTLIAIDGKTYWVKGRAQQGLVAELIAGRLAHIAGAGPISRVIHVSAEALPQTSGTADQVGLVVGSQDMPKTVNARDLAPFMQSGEFQSGVIDAKARGLVIAFQTWLAVGDGPQVLVNLTDGKVHTIDHGDCFGDTLDVQPVPRLAEIPGLAPTFGRDWDSVRAAVERIEAITDRQILEAVSGIPAGAAWNSPAPRRLQIAQWLAERRLRLRTVMEEWAKT